MGVSAVDQILWLTEGRGGRFEQAADGQLRYTRSGDEPASIVPFSGTGLFMGCLPYPSKHATGKFHVGHFWTYAAVDRVRAAGGAPVADGAQRQLDFDRDLMPIVVLEMADLYYRTLLGRGFGDWFRTFVSKPYEAFLDDHARQDTRFDPADDRYEILIEPAAEALSSAAALFDAALTGSMNLDEAARGARTQGWPLQPSLKHFLQVVHPDDVAQSILEDLKAGRVPPRPMSVHALPATLGEALFSWRRFIQPVPPEAAKTPASWSAAVADLLRRDTRWGVQGDATNPIKVVSRSVWREQMKVFAHAVNDGGLTPDAHRRLLQRAKRYRSQLAVGSPLSAMQRVEALVRAGVVNVSVGPGARVEPGPGKHFTIIGERTGARLEVDVLVEGHLRPFDASTEANPLYRNLIKRGLARKWRNGRENGDSFEPGGLDVNETFASIRPDGTVDPRLAFRGWPTEGRHYLQTGLYRPRIVHHVLADAIAWAEGVRQLVESRGRQRTAAAE